MLIPTTLGFLGRGLLRGAPMSAPLNVRLLTEAHDFDMMHRRAGGEAAPGKGGAYGKHGDAHKYCEGYSCGVRQRPKYPFQNKKSFQSSQIVRWRKAKARANRAYLEEFVYGKKDVLLGRHPHQ